MRQKWIFARRRRLLGLRGLAYSLVLLGVAILSFIAGWHAGLTYGETPLQAMAYAISGSEGPAGPPLLPE